MYVTETACYFVARALSYTFISTFNPLSDMGRFSSLPNVFASLALLLLLVSESFAQTFPIYGGHPCPPAPMSGSSIGITAVRVNGVDRTNVDFLIVMPGFTYNIEIDYYNSASTTYYALTADFDHSGDINLANEWLSTGNTVGGTGTIFTSFTIPSTTTSNVGMRVSLHRSNIGHPCDASVSKEYTLLMRERNPGKFVKVAHDDDERVLPSQEEPVMDCLYFDPISGWVDGGMDIPVTIKYDAGNGLVEFGIIAELMEPGYSTPWWKNTPLLSPQIFVSTFSANTGPANNSFLSNNVFTTLFDFASLDLPSLNTPSFQTPDFLRVSYSVFEEKLNAQGQPMTKVLDLYQSFSQSSIGPQAWTTILYCDNLVPSTGGTNSEELDAGRLRKEKMLRTIAIAPNPSQGKTTLGLELAQSGSVSISLRNLQGQMVQEVLPVTNLDMGLHQLKLDLNAQPAGLYLLSIQSPDGVHVQKLVKQ